MKKLFKEWLLLKHCSDTKSTQNADGDSPEPLWKNDGKASLVSRSLKIIPHRWVHFQ